MSGREKRIVAALRAAEPQLREIELEHSGAMGFVLDCTCDLCALLWVVDADPKAWQRRLDSRAAALAPSAEPPETET